MQITDLQDTATEVSAIMKLLAAPNRLMILCQLVEAEQCVGELCEQLGMSPPAMSQQLAILRREGVIASRRDGQLIYYRIDDENVSGLMRFLYDTYCNKA